MSDAEKKTGRIPFLDGLRGIAIVMVVGIHATEYSGLSNETKYLVLSCFQIAISSFFLADGYLFFYQNANRQTFNYSSYLAKSATRLLVPWSIFSAVYSTLRGVFEYLEYLPEKVIIGRTITEIATSIYLSSISSQMYFLLSLFVIRACVPIIKYLSLIPSYVVIVIFVSYTLIWNNWNMAELSVCFRTEYHSGGCFDPVLHALWGLQYYLLGACLYFFSRQFSRPLSIATIIIILYTVTKSTNILPAWLEPYFHLLASYFIMLALVSSENLLTRIGTMTMGVYLIHMPVVLKAVSLIVPAMLGITNSVINYVCITLFTFAVSLVLAKALCNVEVGRYALGYPRHKLLQ